MNSVLRACQSNFGEPPRSLSFGEKLRFLIWPPRWCLFGSDPLIGIYWTQNKLRDRGRVVWGQLVQANSLLFQPGPNNCPANVIYEPVASGERSYTALPRIANSIFGLKGQRHHDTELAECARWVTNERHRMVDAPVPKRLTGGRDVVFSTVMVHRKHLPSGYLSCSMFPLVINPEETPWTMILPHYYWPEGVDELGT
jgi:hypothetical protein